MADNFTWAHMFSSGGPTLIVLILCSLVSLTVIIERLLYFRTAADDGSKTLDRVRAGQTLEAGTSKMTPTEYVLCEAAPYARDEKMFEEVKGRAIAEKIPELERFLNIEATLGTVSPFIGLLGTVVGIIRAFLSLGGGKTGNMEGLNAGIAEALVATAAGLFVAIPATMAYNYFRRRVGHQVLMIEVAASRLREIVVGGGRRS